jgi:hypothetical protein
MYSDVDAFDCEIGFSAKGGRGAYFVIKLKSGSKLISPFLDVPTVSSFTDKAKKYLSGHRP